MLLAWAMMLGMGLRAHAQQRHSNGMDDALQYVPYASVFALKACGVKANDGWAQLAAKAGASWVATAGIAYLLKHNIRERRPDGSDRRSFPSGHASVAFAGATILHKEYGSTSPWISVAGYGVAAFVGIDRVARERHHWYDVAAGAGIGFATAEATWWLARKVLREKDSPVAVGFDGSVLHVAMTF